METKTAQRSELSRDAIVDRALAVADAHGPDAVTIRRLATDFDVTPMALYWHVRNKDELLDAMGDRFYDDIEMPAAGEWSERLRTVVDGLVASLRRHPGAARLAAHRVVACDAGRILTEYTLGVLRGAGFSVEHAAEVARTALQTAVMLVTQQAGAEPEVAAAERAVVLEAKRSAIAGLPPARFPNLIAAADALTSCADDEAYFGFGVDLFISGAEQLHRRLTAQSPA